VSVLRRETLSPSWELESIIALPMRAAQYTLRAKSGGWTGHPDAHSPDYRLLNLTMTAELDGRPRGGNNVQLVIGAPDQHRRGLDEDVAIWLGSGWWVAFRNQFACAADVGQQIVGSAAEQLSTITDEATAARGTDAEVVTQGLFSTTFTATGPAYW
jgi:hypothetical protein